MNTISDFYNDIAKYIFENSNDKKEFDHYIKNCRLFYYVNKSDPLRLNLIKLAKKIHLETQLTIIQELLIKLYELAKENNIEFIYLFI